MADITKYVDPDGSGDYTNLTDAAEFVNDGGFTITSTIIHNSNFYNYNAAGINALSLTNGTWNGQDLLNNTYVNPNTVDQTQGYNNVFTRNIHLQVGSPMIDAADGTYAPSYDIEGRVRT